MIKYESIYINFFFFCNWLTYIKNRRNKRLQKPNGSSVRAEAQFKTHLVEPKPIQFDLSPHLS